MADAPERIWTASTEGKCHVGFATPSMNYTNEYIRADLMAELVEALRITREKLLSIAHSEFDGVWSDQDFLNEVAEADAALAKIKEQTK